MSHRIGILISGRGSNMLALADAVREGRIPGAEIALVISDQPQAPGLVRAAERGIETLLIERRGRSRQAEKAEPSALPDNQKDTRQGSRVADAAASSPPAGAGRHAVRYGGA